MNVVLVHGAFRGGWSFDRLRPLLEPDHPTFAPDLLGMGSPTVVGPPRIHLDDWVDQLVGLVVDADLDDVALFGHSQGGLVVRALGDRLDDRVRLVAYLDAPIASSGERGVDLMGGPPPPADQLPPPETLLPPTPVTPEAGFPPDLVAWVNTRLGPTPFGPSLDPITSAPSSAATAVAFCAGTPDGFPSVVARRAFERAGRPLELVDAPHDAPLTHPELVAAWLLRHLDRT